MRVLWRTGGWLTLLLAAALGLSVAMLYPYSVHESKLPIRWSFVSPRVGAALWFVNSMAWLLMALLATLPAVPALFVRASRKSSRYLFTAYAAAILSVAALMVAVPAYVISLGIIRLSPSGGVAYSI